MNERQEKYLRDSETFYDGDSPMDDRKLVFAYATLTGQWFAMTDEEREEIRTHSRCRFSKK